MERGQLSFFEETNRQKRRITVPIDKVYITLVVCIIAMIISFSLGVEKGKRIHMAKADYGDYKDPLSVVSKEIKTDASEPQQKLNVDLQAEEAQTAETQELATQEIPAVEEPPKKDEIKEKVIEEKQIFYSIQLASYSRKDIALAEVSRLKKKGFEPILLEKGKYWALCVGRFKTKEEARTLTKNFKNSYSDCFIRNL